MVAITSWLVVAITSLLLVAALQLVAEQVLVAHRARGPTHNTEHTPPRTSAPSPAQRRNHQPKGELRGKEHLHVQEYVLKEWVGGGVWAYLPTCLGGWGGWLVGWLVGRDKLVSLTAARSICSEHLAWHYGSTLVINDVLRMRTAKHSMTGALKTTGPNSWAKQVREIE